MEVCLGSCLLQHDVKVPAITNLQPRTLKLQRKTPVLPAPRKEFQKLIVTAGYGVLGSRFTA